MEGIDWVLLDFGGVVADEGFREGIGLLAARHGRDPEEIVDRATDAVYDSGYVLGTGSEADFWRCLGEATGLWVEPLEGENAILSRFRVRGWMLARVGRLRDAGLGVGLLTDQTDWLERLDRRDGFLAAFDRVYNSYRLGTGKRDPALFDEVAADLVVAPGRILFIDDSPGHVERARSRGLRAVLYEDRAQTERVLEEVGAQDRRKGEEGLEGPMMEVPVELGSVPERVPRAFHLGGRREEVAAVLDRWPGSGYLYLKVRAGDGGTYVLRREDATGRWELRLFHAGDGGQLPLSGE